MAFVKIKDKKSKEEAIINTDMICRIAKAKNGCGVFFSCGNVALHTMSMTKRKHRRYFLQ